MRLKITSDEVNMLVYRYLMESGFTHSAFAFQSESHVHKSGFLVDSLPPGALINLLQKGLQYYEIECHLSPDGSEVLCDEPFSLIHPHECVLKGKLPRLDFASSLGSSKSEVAQAPQSYEIDFVQLKGHAAEVLSCSWNPSGETVATGSCDGTVIIWKSPEPNSFTNSTVIFPDPFVKLVHKTPVDDQQRDVICIDWNEEGNLIAAGHQNGLVNIWDEKGALVWSLSKHTKPVLALKWNKKGDCLISAGIDKIAIAWDTKTGEVKQSFQFHSGPIYGIDWKSNIAFATCSADKTIQFCKIGENKPLKVWQGHADEVNMAVWDPSSNMLASCSSDSTIRLWNMRQETHLFELSGHTKEVLCIAWSPTGVGSKNPSKPNLLASGSNDGTVRLWNPEDGTCIHTINSINGHITSIEFSPSGDYVAVAYSDKVLRIYSVKDKTLAKVHVGPSGIFDVSWSRKGDRLAASYAAGVINIFDATPLAPAGTTQTSANATPSKRLTAPS